MAKQFTVNKRGEYYNVEYIGYNPNSVKFDIWYSNNVYFSSKDEVKLFINVVSEFEKGLVSRLKERNINYNPKKIIRMYMNNLDNILIGNDIRAKLSMTEKVDMYIDWYDAKYNEANKFCNIIYQTVVEFNPIESKNWRTYEEYDHKRDIFELDYPDLEGHFGKDPFNELIESLDDIDLKYKLLTDRMDNYKNKMKG